MVKNRELNSELVQSRDRNAELEKRVAELEKDLARAKRLDEIRRKTIYAQGEEIRNHLLDVYGDFITDIEAKDPYTQGHSLGVARRCVMIGQVWGLSEFDLEKLYRAALLHDMGKIKSWDKIDFLKKKLTKEDKQRIREHPQLAVDYLLKHRQGKRRFGDICPIILYHHERFDGKSVKTHPDENYVGYPGEVSGEDIPLLARMLAVADAWDAMKGRPYKEPKPYEAIIAELKRCCGFPYNKRLVRNYNHGVDRGPELQFDPEIVAKVLLIKTVGSKKTRRVHRVSCGLIDRIKKPLEIVVNPQGYVPCRICRPYNKAS
ncbi:HD domain-containing protein [Candidatus Woesearchaeota archaeon]|nr:HD domain-containing protein [Candidatus Woesearchaeota archaeon]